MKKIINFRRSAFTLAGSKCYSRFKKSAFTLAEVLIVLGIIGIVASMTIPTLMNKVAKQEYVTALKKAYSTQTDGWSRLLADEGVQQLEDTSVFQSMVDGSCTILVASNESCKPFYNNLKKYFRFSVIKAPSYQTFTLNGRKGSNFVNSPVLVFSDGSVICYGIFYKVASKASRLNGHMSSYQGWFWIDINGLKKPNTEGRDIFQFELSGDGKLYPSGGKDYSIYWGGNLNWTWQNDSTRCGTAGSKDVSGTEGRYCAARIMDEGWQMNY